MLLLLLSLYLVEPEGYSKEAEETWRADRHEFMRTGEKSYLNLAGLYWLEEGETSFGTSADADIQLPKHTTVPMAGVFVLEGDTVSYRMKRGQRAVINDKTVNEGALKVDDILAHNNLRFLVIKRADRMAIRVRNLRAEAFLEFEKLNFYSTKKRFAIEGIFEAYDEPEIRQITTVVDTEVPYYVPGEITFDFDGRELTVLPFQENEGDDEWLIIFKDETSGKSTYGAGRYLDVVGTKENGGKVILNFNRAHNMGCAYSNYTTCPLPPGENWLPIRIEAGERVYDPEDEI